MKKYNTVLTIAGFDGSGGAGIQADLKTFAALACYGMSILTALPIQNTQGVHKVYDLPIQCIRDQCESIFTDIDVDVVKIGMLQRTEIIIAVTEILIKYRPKYIVLDPVMIATSGHRLLDSEAITTLKEKLVPLTTIITPNIPEAETLSNISIRNDSDMITAAQHIHELGAKACIIKGGHQQSAQFSSDLLWQPSQYQFLQKPRIATPNIHGTGCTFSAAIAAYLSRDLALEQAVINAKEYLHQALVSGAQYQLGHGHGPVHHNIIP